MANNGGCVVYAHLNFVARRTSTNRICAKLSQNVNRISLDLLVHELLSQCRVLEQDELWIYILSQSLLINITECVLHKHLSEKNNFGLIVSRVWILLQNLTCGKSI